MKNLEGKSCEKDVEDNSFRMCETEFPDNMNSVEEREKKLLETILKNACDKPCSLDVSVNAKVDKKAKLCRVLSGKYGCWVDVTYSAKCV